MSSLNPKKVVRKVLPKGAIGLAEESYRRGRVLALQARSGFPARGMRVVAVTGTNGKTTTCCYINEVLKAGGYRTAMFTTAVIEVNGQTQLNTTHRTVPIATELMAFLQQAKRAKVDFLVLETTSQALHQHKLLGVPVEIAVMTNLTQDHLDYHGSMQRYKAAKARLFGNYMKPKFCVLNRDDAEFDYFNDHSVGQVVSYGQDAHSTARISGLKLSAEGSAWQVTEHGTTVDFQTAIPGQFNVQNATAAVCVGKLLGLSPEQLQRGAMALHAVPGRMEQIVAGQPFAVLVDYAHTPDALQNVLKAARGIAKGRVLAVSGSAGDRDKSKRPIMGEILARHADMTFLTDDETYTEDPETIRAAIRGGLESAKGVYQEIPDRTEAIKAAFAAARPGDIVVLAGMGHQDTRNMGGQAVAWDEREIARKLLAKN